MFVGSVRIPLTPLWFFAWAVNESAILSIGHDAVETKCWYMVYT